ncbi:MAG: hypothetical protein IJT16_11860 [Lachnospiraceae bacterium]|nr:hypothetical protein [Lachnospiraceae bacterium]
MPEKREEKGFVSTFGLGFSFAGCFLGAGYVSGRELWQFFGKYGVWGFAGLAVSLVLLFLLGAVTLLLTFRSGETELSELVIPWELPRLKGFVSVFTLIFLFGITCIMTAGVSALAKQAFFLPKGPSGFAFSLLIAVLTLTGLEGMITAFSAIVPVLTVSTAALCIFACFRLPASTGLSNPGTSSSFGALLFSAVVYAAYNMYGSVAILAPFGERLKDRKTLWGGLLLGTLLLLLIAAPILIVLLLHPEMTGEELPMLAVAMALSPGLGRGFALLLFLAMLGTAFSCFLTAFTQIRELVPLFGRHERLSVFLLSLLLWFGSLFGFGRLIDLIYPVFGIIGSFFLACLVIKYRMFRKRRDDC